MRITVMSQLHDFHLTPRALIKPTQALSAHSSMALCPAAGGIGLVCHCEPPLAPVGVVKATMLPMSGQTNSARRLNVTADPEIRLLVRLDGFTNCSRPIAVQVCSLQAGRSLSGFAMPALSGLQRELPFPSAAARWSLPAFQQ
jgi:hypothetical protein